MSDKKDLHLMLSSSFWVKTFSQLIGVSVVMYAAMQIPALALRADTFMQYLHFKMVDAADYLAWWSLLAMLSSACCALQLILNLLSVGCAGFNTVLGPWRPTFMAVMILMQIFQWRLASERFDMVNRAIFSTALSAILAVLPELLYLKNIVWKRAQNSSTSSSESANKLAATGIAEPRSVIVLKTEDMGCIACVDTVRNCVLQLPKVGVCCGQIEAMAYWPTRAKHM